MNAAPPVLQPLDAKAKRTFIMGVLMAMLLAALDQTIVATALPTIGRSLGDVDLLPWVVTAYLFASTVTTPLYGKFSDIIGRRPVLMASLGIFIFGSLLCAVAPTMSILVVARAIQGLGGGGLMSLAQSAIADVVTPTERVKYQSYFASVFVIASVAGPVFGGFIADYLHWSVIFLINLPLGLAAMWVTNRVLKRVMQQIRPHKVDILGGALMTAATMALLLMLNWTGNGQPLLQPKVIGAFVAALLLTLAFILRQRTAVEPFLPLDVLRNRTVTLVVTAAFFAVGVAIGLSIYMPVYMEVIAGMTPSQSGLTILTLMGSIVAGAATTGRLIARIRKYQYIPMVGLTLSTIALLVLGLAGPMATVWVGVCLIGTGIGLGTMFPFSTITVQNAVARHDIGIATATVNFFRSLGSAFGVALFGAITTVALGGIGGHGHGIGSAAPTAIDPVAALAAFHTVFLTSAAALVLAWLCVARIDPKPMH